MPLIAPNTFRVALNGSYDGQPIAHVLDFIPVLVSGVLPERSDLGPLICERLGIAWEEGIRNSQSDLVTYSGCSYLDLDSELGSTGIYNGAPYPVAGLNTGAPFPGNVAGRVLKIASGPRGSRTGSIYLPAVLENGTGPDEPNQWSTVALSDWATRLTDTFTRLEEPGTWGGLGVWYPGMVITRTRSSESGPVWVATNRVEGLSMQTRLASQRRRLDL